MNIDSAVKPAHKTLAIVSGGMDSVTLVYYLLASRHSVTMMSFDYGQRHKRELICASLIANRLSLKHRIVPVDINGLLTGSALTDRNVPVPDGHYAQENMAITVVPNRNMIMLSIAAAAVISSNLDRLATAVHAGDHAIYPDCRPEFINSIQETLKIANEGFIHPDFEMFTPFLGLSKAALLEWGLKHNVPYEYTHTCYRGTEIACGTCGTCVERLEAFDINGATDPIPYSDKVTWKRLVAEHQQNVK